MADQPASTRPASETASYPPEDDADRKANRHGYDLDQFKDAFAAYLPRETATPQQDNDFNSLEGNQSVTQTATSAAESATARDDVSDRGSDVADYVAVAGAEKYNENNAIADVAVPGGEGSERP